MQDENNTVTPRKTPTHTKDSSPLRGKVFAHPNAIMQPAITSRKRPPIHGLPTKGHSGPPCCASARLHQRQWRGLSQRNTLTPRTHRTKHVPSLNRLPEVEDCSTVATESAASLGDVLAVPLPASSNGAHAKCCHVPLNSLRDTARPARTSKQPMHTSSDNFAPPTWARSGGCTAMHVTRPSFFSLDALRAEQNLESANAHACRPSYNGAPGQVDHPPPQTNLASLPGSTAKKETPLCVENAKAVNSVSLTASERTSAFLSKIFGEHKPSFQRDGESPAEPASANSCAAPGELECDCSTASNGADTQAYEHDDEEEEEEVPDAEVLRDQLEWDLGVAETLFTLKALQINEQHAMEERQQLDIQRRSRTRRRVLKSKGLFERLRGYIPITLRKPQSSSNRTAKALEACDRRRESMLGHHGAGFDNEGAGIRRGSVRVSSAGHATVGTAAMRRSTRGANTSGEDRASRLQKFRIAQEEMRTRSQRALFEGLANTAEMSRDRWYIFRPWGAARQSWLVLVALSAGTTSTTSPLLACKICDTAPVIELVELLCDIIFMLDVALHFVVAYQDELRDIIVTHPKHIRERYMYGWFCIDLAGALPWVSVLRACGLYEMANWMRAAKLLRITRVMLGGEIHMTTMLGDTSVNPSLIFAVKLTIAMLLTWHWIACFYHRLSLSAPPPEWPTNLYNTSLEWGSPSHVLHSTPGTRYVHALSWAIAATVGTIRPEPNTMVQLIFSDLMCLFGFIAMAWVVGAATTAVADMQHERQEMSQALSRIARYMRRKHLPREIRLRVLSYYRFHQSSMNILEHEEVLVGLPRAMRMQISLLMHKPIFVQLPLFWLCTEEQMLFIVQRLRPCITTPGEMLVKEGTLGVGLFLLMKGAVEITRNSELLVVLLAVAAFGERALQSDEVSDMSIRALRFCECSILLRSDWLVIEKLNPQIRTWLDVYIQERDRRLQDPTVKTQSMQTKKATLRCGAGCGEWNAATQASTTTRQSQVALKRAEKMRARTGWQNAKRSLYTGRFRKAHRLMRQAATTPNSTSSTRTRSFSTPSAPLNSSQSKADLHVLCGVGEMRKHSIAAIARAAIKEHNSCKGE